MRAFTALLVAASVACPPASAGTIVVDDDGGPGVDFTDIAPAVAAAHDGDEIHVHDGDYTGFVVDGKALVFLALGPNARVGGSVQVSNMPVGASTSLTGFHVDSDDEVPALIATANRGGVYITDCVLQGAAGQILAPLPGTRGARGCDVSDSVGVMFSQCEVNGGAGAESTLISVSTTGGDGIRSGDSNVYAYETTFVGGDGGPGHLGLVPGSGTHAGHAARAWGGFLFADGCAFSGGGGGSAGCNVSGCGGAGDGGDGLRLEADVAITYHTSTTFAGGIGGGNIWGTPGADGVPLRVLSGGALELPGPLPSLCSGDGSFAPCPCGNEAAAGEGCANSTGAGARLTASGTANVALDDLQLHASQAPPNQPGLFFQGSAGAHSPFGDGLRCALGVARRLELVFLDAAGVASSSRSIASAGAVLPGNRRYYQFWYRDSSGPCGTGSNLSNALLADWR